MGGNEGIMEVVAIPRAKKFRYLDLIIEEKEDIDKDINQRIRIGWENEWVLLEYYVIRKIYVRLKEMVYRMVV